MKEKEKIYYLIKDIALDKLFVYEDKLKATLKLLELCEKADCWNDVKSPADLQKAISLGCFKDIYELNEIEVEL